MYRTKGFQYFIRNLSFKRRDVKFQTISAPLKSVSSIKIRLFCNDITHKANSQVSVLHCDENLDLTDYGSVLPPVFNLAAYADNSKILQELIKLGVELYKFESKPDVGEFLIKLNYENEFKPVIVFLHDNGLPSEKMGQFITVNPYIFKEDLSDLEVRINYLKCKKFSKEMISEILIKNPKWLSTPVKKIDERLGFLQQNFKLKGDDVRKIVSQVPSLATIEKKIIARNIYALKEELELDQHYLKQVVLGFPSVLRRDTFDLINTYEYITKVMKVQKHLIIKQPEVLRTRKFELEERHKFLMSLGRAQYNPLLPGYVCLLDLATSTEEEFCEQIANTSVHVYHEFLKTL